MVFFQRTKMIDHEMSYQQVVIDELNRLDIPLEETEVYFFRETPGIYEGYLGN